MHGAGCSSLSLIDFNKCSTLIPGVNWAIIKIYIFQSTSILIRERHVDPSKTKASTL